MTEDRQRRKRTKMFFLREGRLGNWEPYWLRIIVAAALLVVVLGSMLASIITVGVGYAALIVHPLAGGDAKVSGR